MSDDKIKRLIDFRKRTYALLSMQSSLENSSIVDIIEKAVELYINPSIKEIVNKEYGEYEERGKTKKSGRPKTKKDNSEYKNNTSINSKNKDNEISITDVEDNLTDEEQSIIDCYM